MACECMGPPGNCPCMRPQSPAYGIPVVIDQKGRIDELESEVDKLKKQVKKLRRKAK